MRTNIYGIAEQVTVAIRSMTRAQRQRYKVKKSRAADAQLHAAIAALPDQAQLKDQAQAQVCFEKTLNALLAYAEAIEGLDTNSESLSPLDGVQLTTAQKQALLVLLGQWNLPGLTDRTQLAKANLTETRRGQIEKALDHLLARTNSSNDALEYLPTELLDDKTLAELQQATDDAIAQTKTASDKRWYAFGKKSALLFALGCGLTIVVSILKLAVTTATLTGLLVAAPWVAVILAAVALMFTAAANWKFTYKFIPEYLKHGFKGIFQYTDREGKVHKLSAVQKAVLLVLILPLALAVAYLSLQVAAYAVAVLPFLLPVLGTNIVALPLMTSLPVVWQIATYALFGLPTAIVMGIVAFEAYRVLLRVKDFLPTLVKSLTTPFDGSEAYFNQVQNKDEAVKQANTNVKVALAVTFFFATIGVAGFVFLGVASGAAVCGALMGGIGEAGLMMVSAYRASLRFVGGRVAAQAVTAEVTAAAPITKESIIFLGNAVGNAVLIVYPCLAILVPVVGLPGAIMLTALVFFGAFWNSFAACSSNVGSSKSADKIQADDSMKQIYRGLQEETKPAVVATAAHVDIQSATDDALQVTRKVKSAHAGELSQFTKGTQKYGSFFAHSRAPEVGSLVSPVSPTAAATVVLVM